MCLKLKFILSGPSLQLRAQKIGLHQSLKSLLSILLYIRGLLLSILHSDVKPEPAPYTSEELMKVTEEQIAASAAGAWNQQQPAVSQQQGLAFLVLQVLELFSIFTVPEFSKAPTLCFPWLISILMNKRDIYKLNLLCVVMFQRQRPLLQVRTQLHQEEAMVLLLRLVL